MNVICITNRKLAEAKLTEQVSLASLTCPKAFILREKDLSPEEYVNLYTNIYTICHTNGVQCLLHGLNRAPGEYLGFLFDQIAEEKLSADGIQLSMKDFLWAIESISKDTWLSLKGQGFVVGVSTHSVDEAALCEKLGADFVTASHIYPTDCKKGVPARGIDYLRDVCKRVSMPVYALGGIDETNARTCIEAGAAGVCVMSLCMRKDAYERLAVMAKM